MNQSNRQPDDTKSAKKKEISKAGKLRLGRESRQSGQEQAEMSCFTVYTSKQTGETSSGRQDVVLGHGWKCRPFNGLLINEMEHRKTDQKKQSSDCDHDPNGSWKGRPVPLY